MTYQNPNLVMNKPEIFLNLTFGLDWITDTQVRDLMKRTYAFWECTYPDVDTMAYAIQIKADKIAEYWNRMHEIQQITYDPLANVDFTVTTTGSNNTTGTSTVNSNSNNNVNNKNYEFPQNSTAKKQVAEGEGTGTSSGSSTGSTTNNGQFTTTERRVGNMGIYITAQSLIKDEYEITRKLIEEYLEEYKDYFMLCI